MPKISNKNVYDNKWEWGDGTALNYTYRETTLDHKNNDNYVAVLNRQFKGRGIIAVDETNNTVSIVCEKQSKYHVE